MGAMIAITGSTSLHAGPRLLCHSIPGMSSPPSLDGTGNNPSNPNQGAVNTMYRRVAAAHYLDGLSSMIEGPNARYIVCA